MKNLHRILMCSCFALALAPLSAAAETALVYVTNSAGDVVHVIDPKTNKVVQQIKGVGAHGVTFAPDGSRVYVSSEMTETLDVYRPEERQPDQEGQAVEPPEQYRGDEGRPHRGRHLARRRRARRHRSREAGSQQDDPVKGRVHNSTRATMASSCDLRVRANSYFTVIDMKKERSPGSTTSTTAFVR